MSLAQKPWDIIHSSADDCWRTPPEVFGPLNDVFHFQLDAAASHVDALCDCYIAEEDDALGPRPWMDYLPRPDREPAAFCNPPYGRQVGQWVERAYEESRRGLTVVLLVMACTETKWWRNFVWKADEVWLVQGRIRFLDRNGKRRAAAPKGSAIVIFRPHWDGPPRVTLWAQPVRDTD